MTITAIPGYAFQENDTATTAVKKTRREIPEPYHRNTIKFNPTPMLIQMVEIRNITFSYERLINKRMSLAIQAGYLLLPSIDSDSLSTTFVTERTRNGINLAVDYRYYLMKRNCRPAPDGLYLGTYLSYYGYKFDSKLSLSGSVIQPEGQLKGSIDIVNLGFEFGYQFVFNKRWTLDLLLFGPSVSMYSRKTEITGDLTQEEIDQINQELLEKIKEKAPVLGALFAPGTKEYESSKIKFASGFRYSVQIGFHF